jgi:hypothetical protein
MKKTMTLVAAVLVALGCGRQASPPPAQVEVEKTVAASPPKIETPPKPSGAEEQSPPSYVELKLPPLQSDKDRALPKEVVAVVAESLRQELDKDRAATVKKYQSVTVELSGVVRTVGSRGPETFVTLETGPGLGLMCVFADEKQPWAKVSRGQKVKLRGLWPMTLAQDGLVQCTIVERGPSTTDEMSAETLAERFAKDKDDVRKKYAEKPLVVMGVVSDMRRNDLGAVRVFLKGAEAIRVDCGFDAADRAEAESVRMGQRVLLIGEFAALESTLEPALRGCRLIQ